jgi:hypothetical protein|tara:strand:- start:261 stop:476 length:216 start_codon:yes stop_codon:yes gene_type:complete
MENIYSSGNKDSSYLGSSESNSYGVSRGPVSYSENNSGNSVDYSDRNNNLEMSTSARCPGGCSVCKGACRK